jgi:hypothetical protein
MHKNIKVMELFIHDVSYSILNIVDIFNIDHIPLGIMKPNISEIALLSNFLDWWSSRLIPNNRSNIREIIDTIGPISKIASQNYWLSLNDHYWVKHINSELTWEQVNFYDHPFKDEVGDVFIVSASNNIRFKIHGDNIKIRTPDSTTGGALRKKWAIIDGIYCLYKFGTPVYEQETVNEMVASFLLDKMDIIHVPYSLKFFKEIPISVCPNFLTKETEFVSAQWILNSFPNVNNLSRYDHFMTSVENLGVQNPKAMINDMLTFDYLIGNEDRHINNFGIIRNADTLQILNFAPIYDNGASFWYKLNTNRISENTDIPSFPFCDYHSEQIKLVDDFSRINFNNIKSLDNEIFNIFSLLPDFPLNRIEKIITTFNFRIDSLEKFAASFHNK